MYLDSKDKEYYAEIRRYNSVLKEFPENSHVLRERANCRFWHADWKRAANDFELLLQKNPDDVVLWVMMGQACVHGRLPRQAVTACSRAIELDPDFDLPYMHRAWAYRQLKQWDASIADYTKAIELKRKKRATIHSPMYRGMLYMEMGEYEKAADDFTLAISISRACEGLYVLRGKAYIKMKQYEKVVENATALMEIYGEPLSYCLEERSYAYEKLGQKEKAEADLALIKKIQKEEAAREKSTTKAAAANSKEYAKANRKHAQEIRKNEEAAEKTILKYTEAIEADKNDMKAYYQRGLAYMGQGEYKKALKDFNTIDPVGSPGFIIAYHYHRAECYDRTDQITKSLNDYAKVLSLNPNNAVYPEMAGNNLNKAAVYEMADIYRLLGDTDKEIACLEKFIEFCPLDYVPGERNIGLYEVAGKYEKAVEFNTSYLIGYCSGFSLDSWRRARSRSYYQGPRIKKLTAGLALAPENAALYFLRGKAHDDTSQFEEAVADYTKAISLKPDMLIAYYYRALANAVLSDYHCFSSCDSESLDTKSKQTYYKWKKDEADTLNAMIADLRKVIHLNNNLAFAYRELGILYNAAGKHKSAISCFNKSLVIDPKDYRSYTERSKSFEKMKNYQAAIDDLSSYLQLCPHLNSSGSFFERRAGIYSKMGEFTKAIEDYSKAIEIEEENSWRIPGQLERLLEKRGKCYQALGEEARARADFDKAAELGKKEWRE